RSWELYVGSVLLGAGLSLQKGETKGPDFLFDHHRTKVWIEATAVRSGQGPCRFSRAWDPTFSGGFPPGSQHRVPVGLWFRQPPLGGPLAFAWPAGSGGSDSTRPR